MSICFCLLQEFGDNIVFAKPNIYCHFAQGIGDPKYLPIPNWQILNKLLVDCLDSYNEVNAVMNLVSDTGIDSQSEDAPGSSGCENMPLTVPLF